ncbi:GNAT family N-acetyltransferase [Streptomyces luteolus]|uniref:GNAT family N-acetyltransferase n=1 Tax=Streptomyces luteolus TaxID=3043615 RepID=A0ABT6T125_9ACTN|nr:GNAT family N-acetyltransferase [Streptomyces sp. B-S-A12]MDI3421544.1 GNAT family N-acetyltransferase [Streptomyces sp. B-S-A12]
MTADPVIRQVRPDEWPEAKALRLTALRDPLARLAFGETYEGVRTQSEQFWKDRTAKGAEGGPHRQFIAEGPAGAWVGTVTVRVKDPGSADATGSRSEPRQAHLVAVFVRPEHRGGDVARGLFRAAVDWARAEAGVERVRLRVHRENGRAEAFYRKAGFVRVAVVGDEYEMEYRPTS